MAKVVKGLQIQVNIRAGLRVRPGKHEFKTWADLVVSLAAHPIESFEKIQLHNRIHFIRYSIQRARKNFQSFQRVQLWCYSCMIS